MNIKYWFNIITQHTAQEDTHLRSTNEARTKNSRPYLSLSLPHISNYQQTLSPTNPFFLYSPNSPLTISHSLVYSPTNSFNQENSFAPTIPHHQQRLVSHFKQIFKRQSVSQHRHLSALVFIKGPA